MNPDFLITRDTFMGILNINNPNKFRDMVYKGLIPAPFGQFKHTHLWSISLAHDFGKRVNYSEDHFSEDHVLDATLDGIERLIETRTMKLYSR